MILGLLGVVVGAGQVVLRRCFRPHLPADHTPGYEVCSACSRSASDTLETHNCLGRALYFNCGRNAGENP